MPTLIWDILGQKNASENKTEMLNYAQTMNMFVKYCVTSMTNSNLLSR